MCTLPRIGFATVDGRPHAVVGGGCHDLGPLHEGRYLSDPNALFAELDAVIAWANQQPTEAATATYEPGAAGPAVASPRQVFAIGLNYRGHAAEANLPVPTEPVVFTKFPSCLAGPQAPITLTSNRVDWEVELVVVVGQGGRHIPQKDAWSRMAGLCIGQDVSDRRLQFAAQPPQFSLGKSAPGFGPLGPLVVPLQDIAHPDDLAISCEINGERMQDNRTSDMVFSVPELVSYLSGHCELYPGDLIFTGTPAGVGSTRSPRRYLQDGDIVRSEIEGLGHLQNRVQAGSLELA